MLGKGKKTTDIAPAETAKAKESNTLLKRNQSTLKDIIAPGGIDASYTNHIAIMSSRTRFARSMLVSVLPRMCTDIPTYLIGAAILFGASGIITIIQWFVADFL